MLIMSQDRKRIVNIDNVSRIGIGNEWDNGMVRIEASDIPLGTYATVDDAKTVLEGILKAYQFEVRTLEMPADREGAK